MPEAGHGVQLNDGTSVNQTHSVEKMVLLVAGRAGGLAPGVGIGAAYLALGAPDFQHIAGAEPGEASISLEQLATSTGEHDLKLAYSCRTSARALADPSYEWVASCYLATRNHVV